MLILFVIPSYTTYACHGLYYSWDAMSNICIVSKMLVKHLFWQFYGYLQTKSTRKDYSMQPCLLPEILNLKPNYSRLFLCLSFIKTGAALKIFTKYKNSCDKPRNPAVTTLYSFLNVAKLGWTGKIEKNKIKCLSVLYPGRSQWEQKTF